MPESKTEAKHTAMSVTDRKALRQVVTERFDLLRLDVRRREQELIAEIKEELVRHWRKRDKAVRDAQKEVEERGEQYLRDLQKLNEDYRSSVRVINDTLTATYDVDVVVKEDKGVLKVEVKDKKRAAAEEAINAKIPAVIADANLQLRRLENTLQMELAMTGLESDAARAFISKIPDVGTLVPAIRLKQLFEAPEAERVQPKALGSYEDDLIYEDVINEEYQEDED